MTVSSRATTLMLLLGGIWVAVMAARWSPVLRAWSDERHAEVQAMRIALDVAGWLNQQGTSRQVTATLGMRAALEARLFPGRTPHDAATGLVVLLEGYAASTGVELNAVSVDTDSTFDRGYSRIRARVWLQCEGGALIRFLRATERATFILRIEQLAITQSDPTADDATAERLQAEVLISSLARADSSPMGRP